jgi:hypothetical protein
MWERYLQGTLTTPEELRAVDEHLRDCPVCREALQASLQESLSALPDDLMPAASEASCPEEELLLRYVEGKADAADREFAEAHLAHCARCAQDVAHLQAFREEMQGYDWSAAKAAARPAGRLAWLRDWWTASPTRRAALPAGGTMAAAAVAGLLVFWTMARPVQQEAADLRAQLRQLQQTNAALRSQASAAADAQARIARLEAENRKMRAAQQQSLAELGVLKKENGAPKDRLAALQTRSHTPQPGPAQLALNDGGRPIVLDRQGNLTGLEGLSEDLQQRVRTALMRKQAPTPSALALLAGKASTLRGGAHAEVPFALRGPIGTFVESGRPTFRWQPLAGATGYTVYLVEEGADREIKSALLPPGDGHTQRAWTLPDDLPPLRRGSVYEWYVLASRKEGETVQSPGKSAPEARFRVLSAEQAAALERIQAAAGGSHLGLGVLYAQAGLLDEAEREFRALQMANPTSSVARSLLQSVQRLRR